MIVHEHNVYGVPCKEYTTQPSIPLGYGK